MTIYEYGTENDKSILFIATAALEPYWAFQKQAEALLRRRKTGSARSSKNKYSYDHMCRKHLQGSVPEWNILFPKIFSLPSCFYCVYQLNYYSEK